MHIHKIIVHIKLFMHAFWVHRETTRTTCRECTTFMLETANLDARSALCECALSPVCHVVLYYRANVSGLLTTLLRQARNYVCRFGL